MTGEILQRLREGVRQRIDPLRETSEEEVRTLIEDELDALKTQYILPVLMRLSLSRKLFNELKRLDLLQPFLEDESITEIMVNNSYSPIYVEKGGVLYATSEVFDSDERLVNVAQRIASMSNKIVNELCPIVDTRLEDGSRVNIVLAPTLLGGGAAITIRKFYKIPLTMERMVELGTLTKDAAIFLQQLVFAKYNIFISGGTGSGKTTFLNALSNYIPPMERIITIEDSAELQLLNAPNLVRLEARDKNLEGRGEIRISDLIRTALRMRPDRIIVGEVRGEEAQDMLAAMQTGHDGSLSTGHANDPEDMCLRLETMIVSHFDMPVSAIRQQIASAVDIMVHLERMPDGSRKVVSISEVVGVDEHGVVLKRLFAYEGVSEQGEEYCGTLCRTGETLKAVEKLRKAGITDCLDS